MRKHKIIIALISVCILFITCRKEKSFSQWETDILVPLVKSTLSINDLISDSILQANADSSIKIVYHNEFYNFTIDSLLSIPDTTIQYSFPPFFFPTIWHLTAGFPLVPSTVGETTFDLNGIELTSAKVKSGTTKVYAKNEFKEMVTVTYTIPCAKLNSVPFFVTEQVPAATSSGPAIFTKTYSLAGYEIDLRGINGKKVNTVQMVVTASVNDSVTIFSGDSLILRNTISDIFPSYAKGYFGSDTINIGPDESSFALFDKVTNGSLLLENADMNLKVENFVGIDARLLIRSLSSTNSKTANVVNLSAPVINTPININRAVETGIPANPILPSNWGVVLNNSNSNCKNLIENLPDKLGYSLKIVTNPLGNISGSNDFIFSDQTLKASLDMEVPLSLLATDLTLADTVDFNLQGGENSKKVNHGVFTLFANNGFPFDATVQLYLLDENGSKTDSLLTLNNVIGSGILDGSYKVVTKKLTKIPIAVDAAKMEKLRNTTKMLVVVKYDTSTNPQLMKIYSYYAIDVKIVGDFNFSVDVD